MRMFFRMDIIIADCYPDILDNALENDESETTIELNLAVLKCKHTIKKRK